MLQIPAQMQPTLDRWKQTQSLGEGMKFGASGSPAQYEQLMDQVVLMDNKANDSAPESGLVVCKDDGETLRFQGDSKQGSLEAACADGRVIALNFNEKSVDFLQLTSKPQGIEAMQEHYDRQTGKGWMQVGGAVTVINMDQPGALEQIFAPQAAPTVSSEHAAKAQAIGQGLATLLNVSPDSVKVSEFSPQKGFNASNCDFAVAGELQMSAWTEGIESKFECDGQKYVYRGLDEKTGRYGQDVAHQGYWKQDERGIFVPDLNAPKEDLW